MHLDALTQPTETNQPTSDTGVKVMASGARLSAPCHSQPPATWRRLRPEGARALASRMRRFLLLPFSTSRPSGV